MVEKRGRDGGASENCAETHPCYRLAPARKGHRPLLMGTGTASGSRAVKDLVAIEASSVILASVSKPKWNSLLNADSGDRVDVWGGPGNSPGRRTSDHS